MKKVIVSLAIILSASAFGQVSHIYMSTCAESGFGVNIAQCEKERAAVKAADDRINAQAYLAEQQRMYEQKALKQLKEEGYLDDIMIQEGLAAGWTYSMMIKEANSFRTARMDFMRLHPKTPFNCDNNDGNFTCYATK